MKSAVALLVLGIAGASAACGAGDSSAPAGDPLSGGATTVFDTTQGAYANQAANLTNPEAETFSLGHTIFDQTWVTAPATTSNQDGLGPRFNQRSCSACHSHDGRSPPFDSTGAFLGLLLRLSIPGSDDHGGPLGDPVYGTQLRPNAIIGIPPDGVPHVTYQEAAGTYGDGSAYSLQAPHYAIDPWNYGTPSANLMISPRVGPFAIGLGLLEAIPEASILANVRSSDPDGVVGRANYVWDTAANAQALGRFGWKANVPSVLDQASGALVGDMGITSSLFPDETCTPTMTACNAAPSGGHPEIDESDLDALTFYMRTLAVPARRQVSDPTALHGADLFHSFGCATCHVDTFETGAFPSIPQVENQTIHPYTDLLLHDMGPDLADGRPDYQASGSEWRTPPLWGIGLLQTVNGHELLLHDARARGMAEAILWHGGEATAARERFRKASAADRAALITFLHSL